MRSQIFARPTSLLLFLLVAPLIIHATDILQTSGFSECLPNSDINVERVDIQYNRQDKTITFDVAGGSFKEQNVTASLVVTAYGNEVYKREFDPCDDGTRVDQLCPVPVGNFAAKGSQKIPDEFASLIPDIAFQLPDLDGVAKLQLKPAAGGPDLACIQSPVNNGKTAVVPAVSYVAVGVTGAALLLSGVSALGAVSAGFAAPGASAPSPSFGEVLGWMQSMALNGMLSVDYPPVYRSFTKNFGFSCGLVPWNDMQAAIDSFRGVTGGNLTANSVAYLRNVTLVYHDGSSSGGGVSKRSLDALVGGLRLLARDVTTSVNGSETTLDGLAGGENATETDAKDSHFVEGIKAYAAQLTIPDSNMFMSILMVFAIVIAAIVVGILVFKLVLELWALCASFPKGLTGFRKRYWGFMGRTIVSMILVLYGVWTLYCVYQFTHGDSWGAKALAGVTLVAFTAVLGFFTFRIWQLARRFKKAEGDAKALFEDKETWRKYSLFYDQYKKGWWWLFVPVIVYMFARGCVIAAGDGHGLFQTSGQLVIEALMLMLLLWSRPYATKAGQWINIVIQVVRVLSVVCILVFVDQLGVAQTTKTVTGVVLIAVQSVLTAALAILIAVNAIIVCCRENPHRKRRKEAEKLNRDLDNLTPLDPRNSLLMEPRAFDSTRRKDKYGLGYVVSERDVSHDQYPPRYRSESPEDGLGTKGRRESTEGLVTSAAAMPYSAHRGAAAAAHHDHPWGMNDAAADQQYLPPDMDRAPPPQRQPTLPNTGYR